MATEILINPRMPVAEQELARKWLPSIESRELTLRDEDHYWVATSGTTGPAAGETKWVAISKRAIRASARAVNEHLSSNEKDVWVHALPRFHVGGLGIDARGSQSGARVVDGLQTSGRCWDPRAFFEICTREKATLSALVPTQLHDLIILGDRAPQSMRAVIIGGGALSDSLYTKARALGWPVLPSYGMSECASQIATASAGSPAMKLLSHIEAETVDSENGRLRVRSPALFTGYAFVSHEGAHWESPIDASGWFLSPDRVEVLPDRSLRIQGRVTDFVKIGGESVDLARLESILAACCAEAGASESSIALFPVPDVRLGHVIHGVMEERDAELGHRAFELFHSRVMPFEKARKVHVISALPRSPLGKLLRAELLRILT